MSTDGGGSEKSQSKGSELSQPMGGITQNEPTDGSQLKLPLITQEPLREDQVQNAVKFLSHPKVRGSPVMYRRSFLERKGLGKEEIDEAFRRVPDPPSSATTAEAITTSQAIQTRTSTSLQPQASVQPPLPAAAQVGAVSLVPTSQKPRLNWSHALIAIGILSASGAGSALVFKKRVLPRLKAWIRRVAVEDTGFAMKAMASKSLAAETAEAAKAAASAAAIVATASQELLNSKNEERKCFEAFMGMVDMQVKEMKSMSEAIHKLEKAREQQQLLNEYVQYATANGTSNNSWKKSQVNQADAALNEISQFKANGTLNTNYGAGQPLTPPVKPTTASHPKSYMEIMAMVQRGEKPPNIREINDMPPNPNQPPSKPLIAPITKPWEISQQSSVPHPQVNGHSQDLLSEPWWRKKAVNITGSQSATNDWPSSQRTWVPPQPSSVAIPEAAAAIRHPKSLPPTQEQSSGDGKMLRSSIDSNGVAACTFNSERDGSSVVSQQSEIEEVRDDGVEVI